MTARFRLTLIHTVPDYDRWSSVMRESRRKIPGVIGMAVYRSIDEPNEVMVDVDVDSMDAAQRLLQLHDLRDLLDRSGIEIYPPVFIGERVDDLST